MAEKKSPPSTLTHYTTLEGLMGIVTSKSLWASNASFLNDKAELSHALSASQKAILMLSSDAANKTWSKLLKRVFSELAENQPANSYVACFCGDDDNLSQWRGYGGATQGISVSFNRVRLEKRLKSDRAKLYQVIYAKLSTAAKLRKELDDELASIADLEELIGEQTPEERYKDLLTAASALLPKFKHLGFKDEREWRFVVQRTDDGADIKFRALGNKIVPYIVIGANEAPLPIASIRVGPGTDQELTARSLAVFLASHGYDVPVNVSDVPFRL